MVHHPLYTALLKAIHLAFAFAMVLNSAGQCTNNNTLTGAAMTPTCPGNTSVACVQGGQYALVNVTSGNIYTFSTCGASWDTQITLFNNTGGGSLGYNDDNGSCGAGSIQSHLTWTATFTGQLRVLLDQYNCTSNTTCATLAISCSPPPAAPTNGTPCTNTLLTVQSTCGGGVYSNTGAGTFTGAPAPTCGNYNTTGGNTNNHSKDVWFRFVAGPTGGVNIFSEAGTLTNGAMAVYSAASCSGPFTQISCDDDNGNGDMPQLNLTGLTPGQTYFIRFWGYGNATGSFTLCVQGLTSLPAGDCVYVLNMNDAFGDGWGTSFVGISVDGAPYQNHTVTGSSNQVMVGVNVGQVVSLNYNASGAWQSDNSFTLMMQGGGGALYHSGSPPTAGMVYTQTVSCEPPPAAQEDCIGSHTICSTENINNNTTNTGLVNDLTTTTAGCLANTERQGTWYNFSSTTNGTIAFAINPSDATDDYDFAIWGPYAAGTSINTICPPSDPPIRCSYSGQTGATGLNYTASDLSEGATGNKWVQYLDVTVGQIYLLYISNWSQSGLAFTLNWDLGGGTSTLDCTVLPVELLGMELRPVNEDVQVEWVTATENGSDRFIVERSADGETFGPIGSLPAAGSSTHITTYGFLDKDPLNGVNYYRLQQIDLDGQRHISFMRSIHLSAKEITIAPNPAEDQVRLLLPPELYGELQISLYDPYGRVIKTWNSTRTEGDLELDLSGVAAGRYVLEVHPVGGARPQRLAVVKL